MSFKITSLTRSQFEHLFDLAPEELSRAGAMRTKVTKQPGFPCRVSLADAEIGEDVLLVHYEHQRANTPFRASHAVYVRPLAKQANLEIGEVPEMLRSRILSIRGFDPKGMMTGADLVDGKVLEAGLKEMFTREDVAYIHLHFAKPGCYAARVDRAS